MSDRKQDMWRVTVSSKNEMGKLIHGLRIEGVVDLPRPMTALEAADQTLRVTTRKVGPLPFCINVDVWGRTDIGSDSMRQCSAVADYDDQQKKYRRYVPWEDHEYEEISEPDDGVTIIKFA